MTTSVIQPIPANLPDKRKTPGLSPVLRKDVASNGPAGLPVVLVLGSFAAVAYADHLVVAISLVYLYLLPWPSVRFSCARKLVTALSQFASCFTTTTLRAVCTQGSASSTIFPPPSASHLLFTSSSAISNSARRSLKRSRGSVTNSFTTSNWPRKFSACFFPLASRPSPDLKSQA